MGDLKVTCSPAIYELFYEKVITEIIEVSENEKKKRIRNPVNTSLITYISSWFYVVFWQPTNL